MTVYAGAQNGCLCAYVGILLINVTSTSSALAVARKELVEQHLKHLVLGHDVVLAQIMPAGGAGVHLRSERPLETSLTREKEGGRNSHTDTRTGMLRGGSYTHICSVRTLQTLCEQMVVMGWKASSWQHTHMKICSILRRKFFICKHTETHERNGKRMINQTGKHRGCYNYRNNLKKKIITVSSFQNYVGGAAILSCISLHPSLPNKKLISLESRDKEKTDSGSK